MGYIKKIGLIEIVIGLLLIMLSVYFMIESTFMSGIDMHGYLLFLTIFGSSIGALLSFSGAITFFSKKYKLLAHAPLVIYVAVVNYVFDKVY